MKRKITAILVAAAMIVALLPVGASAKTEIKTNDIVKVTEHIYMNSEGNKYYVLEDEDEELGLAEIKEAILIEIEACEIVSSEFSGKYSESVSAFIEKAYKEMRKIAKDAGSFEELGLKFVSYSDDYLFGGVEYEVTDSSIIIDRIMAIEEIVEYWPSSYIDDISDVAGVRNTIKTSVENYFKAKEGVFNEYYESCIKGVKAEQIEKLNATESIETMALIRQESRSFSEMMLDDYVQPYDEKAVDDDDDDDDDWDDDDWDDDSDADDEDSYYDEDMEDYSTMEMNQKNIETVFEKNASGWLYDYSWNKAPESIKVESLLLNVSYFATIEELKNAVAVYEREINKYINFELKNYDGDIDKVKEIADRYLEQIKGEVTIDNIVYDLNMCEEEMMELTGIEWTVKNSTELGKDRRMMEDIYDRYFVEGQYSFNGYKELYRIYGYCYANIATDPYVSDFPENYIAAAEKLMDEIPTLLEETRTKYISKLEKYLNNAKYNQKLVKPVVAAAKKEINNETDAAKIKDIYNKYKKKADQTVKTFKITTSKSGKGTITASKTVTYGKSFTVKIKPSKGYSIKSISVDGKKIKKTTSYTFKNVKKAHNIKVVFVKK